MEHSWQYILTVGALLCALAVLYTNRQSRRLPFPPGPKRYPIIGSLFEMPAERQWVAFDKWCKKYGDIVYTEVLGNKFVILGSSKRANDLFMERSAIYSDRMLSPMMDLMGWGGWNMAMQGYGPQWRAHRRMFNDHFRANIVSKFHPIQMRQVRGLQRRLLDSPDDFLHHIRHTVSSIILAVVYGIQVKESNDPYTEIASEATNSLGEVGPGAFLVDVLPVLKYVPQWFPGAGFQKKAAYWKSVVIRVVDEPWEFVKRGYSDGTAMPCISTELLEEHPEEDKQAEQEQIAKNIAAVAYIGGADTTASNAQSFVLAMAMYPDVQKKAQAELDTVIGRDRLPDLDDLDSLPYIDALVKETLRWQPVSPVGIPHASSQDDEYDGFFIPKGTFVIGNSWSILHDPEMYPEPEEFRPDRFLKDGKINPEIRDSIAAFGYGRRICPGQFMAVRSLFAIVSSLLSTFDISAPLDESGRPIELEPAMTPGIISVPLPYKCTIRPRSEAAVALICDSVDTA